MADITLSPIPYNGGTLTLANKSSHICHLSGNKFFALFGQTTPNYTFAATINVNDIHAGTPVASVGKQRVMNQVALTRARVWKLSATSVLALVNSDLVVFKVQPDDDIVQAAATSLAFHATYLWGTETESTSGIGEYLHGQYIKDNTVWFVQRTSTTSAIKLVKVEYDPVLDTLIKTDILTIAASTTATHYWRHSIQKIPGTSNWLVYSHGGNTAITTSTITAYYIYDSNGNQVSAVSTGVPATAKLLVALANNRVLALSDAKTYRVFDGVSWSTTDTTFAAAVTASTSLICAEALDANYFMLVSTSSGTEPGAAAGGMGFRVSRFIDATFGQTSVATNTANGIAYSTAAPYFDQRQLQAADATNETFVVLGRASTTSFRIRVLYQPIV